MYILFDIGYGRVSRCECKCVFFHVIFFSSYFVHIQLEKKILAEIYYYIY